MRDSHSITRFKGVNAIDSAANVAPGAAISSNNVIADPGGALQLGRQLRTLIDFSAEAAFNLAKITSLGLLDVSGSNIPPRLVIQQGPHLMAADAPAYPLSAITGRDFGIQLGRLDYAQSASVLYFSSGADGGKLLSGDLTAYEWGLPQSTPPVPILSTTFLGVLAMSAAGGVVTLQFAAPHGHFVTDPVYVDSGSGVWPDAAAGLFQIATVPAADTITYLVPGIPAFGPVARATYPEGLTAATGYQYRGCWGFSKTGHWGTASLATATIGPLISQSPVLLSPVPPVDSPEIDQYALFRNVDDGGDWYLVAIVPFPQGAVQVAILDTTTDDTLEASAQTPPYDNGMSPNGAFLCAWLDRILMCGVEGDEETVYYSGYDSINFGRPQESWCQFNRISIGQGESTPNAIGITTYGAVFFCTNKQLYIAKGTLNDITTSAVTPLSYTVRQLPYQVGNYSHYSTQSTPLGIVFLSDAIKLTIFDGYNPPQDLAPQLNGVLARLTPGFAGVITSEYLEWIDRQWYILCIPVDGSGIPNLTIIIDLSADATRNTGAWVFDYAIDALKIVRNPDATKTIVCASSEGDGPGPFPAAGYLSYLPYIFSNQDIDVLDRTSYRMGYFGIKDEDGVDEWGYFKLFRYLRLATALPGCHVRAYCVDGQDYTFELPLIVDFTFDTNYGALNVKTRAVSLEFNFPTGVAAPLLALTLAWNFAGKR